MPSWTSRYAIMDFKVCHHGLQGMPSWPSRYAIMDYYLLGVLKGGCTNPHYLNLTSKFFSFAAGKLCPKNMNIFGQPNVLLFDTDCVVWNYVFACLTSFSGDLWKQGWMMDDAPKKNAKMIYDVSFLFFDQQKLPKTRSIFKTFLLKSNFFKISQSHVSWSCELFKCFDLEFALIGINH